MLRHIKSFHLLQNHPYIPRPTFLAALNRSPAANDLLDAVSVSDPSMLATPSSRGVRVRAAAVLLLALGVLGASARAAAASHMPAYSISVVEGVTTLPEDSILSTSASAPDHVSVTLRILRAGSTIAQNTSEGGAWLPQVPQVGEAVTLEAPTGSGQLVGSIVYDGLPSMDPTVCAGSTNFSGQRTPGTEVEGSYFTLVPHSSYVATHHGGAAQITSLVGTAFGGNFLTAPALGQTLSVREHVTTVTDGISFTYESETDRPVGSCPPPPPPPPAPAPPPALSGTLLKLPHTSLRNLLRSGHLTDQVTINQPGTVTQDLYLENGTIPAAASTASVKHRHTRRRRHKPAATLIAAGSTSATVPGTVGVTLKLTARGRRRLEHAHNVRLVLVTTLHATTGAKLNLGRRSISLHR